MRESFSTPQSFSRLITDKDQFKHPVSLESNPIPIAPSWHKELEPIDTTYEGFEKYLDPYLTTSRLHHRPYTADQLKKISNSKDIVTYYTLSDIPWVWSTKPTHKDWFVRVKCPKTMYDREKFKGDFREIRSHNKLHWVPGSFRTEAKDNYGFNTHQKDIKIEKHEEVSTKYQRAIGKLKTNSPYEDALMQGTYVTESSTIGSRKPICSVFEQCADKNKRLMSRLEKKK
ncbi:uncharacterized protein LOC106719799 [Papilio machaon]|uniref:uncharacterized protein LOC106719799 n=1 Tax=Papilio machaon TaxID=76193 RepID=UPI001E663D48|nr:uncharacterized protein LOC106719799 [Papilio machaon]